MPADHPNRWELKSEQLLFQEIQGRHTGKNMAYLGKCVGQVQTSWQGVIVITFISFWSTKLLYSVRGWLVYQ